MLDWKNEKAQVVLRFHYGKRGSVNPIISKTMGRVAVISHSYQGTMPQPGTFWLCEIEREIGNEKPNGCFVVVPVKEVKIESVMRLVPGTYQTEIHGSTVVCRPMVEGHYWIIPFSLKKYFIKEGKAQIQYQSVVVPLRISAASQPV